MPRKAHILELLKGGDRRGIGRADDVAARVTRNARLFPALLSGMWHEDRLVRMRAADACEKITRTRAELLQPHKKAVIGLLSEATEQELRWHLAVMVPRLALSNKERELAASALEKYLGDRSSIVKTSALQGLADLAREDQNMRAAVVQILQQASRNGTAAMKARSRKLLLEFAEE